MFVVWVVDWSFSGVWVGWFGVVCGALEGVGWVVGGVEMGCEWGCGVKKVRVVWVCKCVGGRVLGGIFGVGNWGLMLL